MVKVGDRIAYVAGDFDVVGIGFVASINHRRVCCGLPVVSVEVSDAEVCFCQTHINKTDSELSTQVGFT